MTGAPADQAALLDRARSGDQAAFSGLITRYEAGIRLHCYRMLGSFHDAEDVTQEMLVRAWRHLGSFDGRSSVRTWLYRIAANRCLTSRRGPRQRRRREPPSPRLRRTPRRSRSCICSHIPAPISAAWPRRSPGRSMTSPAAGGPAAAGCARLQRRRNRGTAGDDRGRGELSPAASPGRAGAAARLNRPGESAISPEISHPGQQVSVTMPAGIVPVVL